MVDRQGVFSKVPPSEIEFLTYDAILLIARGAFAGKEEDANYIVLFLEFSLKPALIGVKEFLGHDSQVHGGTVGDPNAAGVCPPINKRPLVSCSEQLGILFLPAVEQGRTRSPGSD